MGLFNFKKKKQEEEIEEEVPQRQINPSSFVMIRLLAVGYVLWLFKDMVTLYIEGGEDAPSLPLLIGTGVVFIGFSVWIAIVTYKQYKRMKAEQAVAEVEEEPELLQEAEDHTDDDFAEEAEAEPQETEE